MQVHWPNIDSLEDNPCRGDTPRRGTGAWETCTVVSLLLAAVVAAYQYTVYQVDGAGDSGADTASTGYVWGGLLQLAALLLVAIPGCWWFVTIRRRQNEALARLVKSEKRYNLVTGSVRDAIIALSSNGQILTWNRAASEIFKRNAADVVGTPLSRLIVGTGELEKQSLDQAMLDQLIGRTVEMEGIDSDGEHIPIEVLVGDWTEDEDHFYSLVARDVSARQQSDTEREILQSQLDQARKLEAVGQLAAGIAHEINTPTQYVGDNTRFLQEAFEDLGDVLAKSMAIVDGPADNSSYDDLSTELKEAMEDADVEFLSEEIPKAIEQSLIGLRRVSKIVGAMKEFSHPSQGEMIPTDLNQAIESTVTVATNEWKYVAELETDFDPELPAVQCMPGEFNQVVLNMVVNAAHAIGEFLGENSEDRGKITVSTRKLEELAEIRIADTGAGMPEEVKGRVFDPFFTTKEVGKGTGQGLSIGHDIIVNKHGGSIDIESEVGQGTTFVIRIPLTQEAAVEE